MIDEIKLWKQEAKATNQTALYEFICGVDGYIRSLKKGGFTRSPADAAFADYIKRRDNYTCQKCGKVYPPKSQGLQCSHHFSRRYYNIRFDPDNAMALCYHCHVYWYQKDIPEAARWLEQKLGKDKIDRLIQLKNEPQKQPTKEQIDVIIAKLS